MFGIIGGGMMAGYNWLMNKDNEEYDKMNYMKWFIMGLLVSCGSIFGYSLMQTSHLVSDQEIYTGSPDF